MPFLNCAVFEEWIKFLKRTTSTWKSFVNRNA